MFNHHGLRIFLVLPVLLLFFSCGEDAGESRQLKASIEEDPSLSQTQEDKCSDVSTIATEYYHTVGLKKDGTVVAAGYKGYDQLNVSSWTDIRAIAVGFHYTVGLKEDGSVVAVGYNGYGQLNVSSWQNIKSIAADYYHTVGLKEDGSVVAVGYNGNGQMNVSSWKKIKAIAAGGYHTIGLKEDGTVEAVGSNANGQLNISSWAGIKAIEAGSLHTVGLKEDGWVVAVGYNGYGQLNTSSWTSIKAVATGFHHTVGLKQDGTVVAVGHNGYGQLNVSSWKNVKAIAAGGYHTIGLKEDGTVLAVGYNGFSQLSVSSWTDIMSVCEPVCDPGDATAPITMATTAGTMGNNGWYLSDVQMILTATDNDGGSGVKEIHYSVDGAETVVQGSSASYWITGDGIHAVTWYAIDNAGNNETPPVEMNINIDKTPPSIPSLAADPAILWPPNRRIINVLIDGAVVDGGSGIASTIITATDEYGLFSPVIIPDFGIGIALESWRAGSDMDGRVYTITAVATDEAGNQATGTTTVLVPHDMH